MSAAGIGLPLGDPQFWLATALVAGAVAWLARRAVRARRRGEPPCPACPKSPAPRRLR